MDNKNYFNQKTAKEFQRDMITEIEDMERTLSELEDFILEVKLENIDDIVQVYRIRDIIDKLTILNIDIPNLISDLL